MCMYLVKNIHSEINGDCIISRRWEQLGELERRVLISTVAIKDCYTPRGVHNACVVKNAHSSRPHNLNSLLELCSFSFVPLSSSFVIVISVSVLF